MLTGIRGTALREAAQNAGAVVIYGLLFCALWKHSIDQWYLPAGLRFAALLVTPARRWVALYLGEFAALFLLRQYMVPFFGMPWLLVGSAALFPVTAVVVWVVKRFAEPVCESGWRPSAGLIAGAVSAAITSKLTVYACLMWLAIPFVRAHTPNNADGIISHYSRLPAFVLGDLLGILLVAPITMVWLQRKALGPLPALGWQTGWTMPAFAVLFIATASLDRQWQQAACYLMFVPAAALTIAMGWRGAVLGTLAANAGIALGMHHAQIDGASDPAMLSVQTVLAVFSISLLGVGAALSHHSDIAKEQRWSAERANEEAQRTLELARMSLKQADQDMHDRAKRIAAGHSSWVTLSRTMINQVRKIDPNAAMELNHTALMEARTFHGEILEALYPLKLEQEGLYTVLRSSAMVAALGETGIQIRWTLLGNPSAFSADLKRMLYRTVVVAIESFSKAEPVRINVYVRCGTVRTWQGGAIVIDAEEMSPRMPIDHSALAAMQHRVHVFGGKVRQHRDRVTVLLSECAPVRAARAA